MSEVEPNFDHDALDDKRKGGLIDKAADVLGEDFDAIIILASYRTETGGTGLVCRGRGNYHAQNGMMQHILTKRRAMTDQDVRRNMEND